MLPDPARDDRSDATALAVAVGGVMCPVPFLMPAVAIRMARGGRRSRRSAAAFALSVLTILGQLALIAYLLT